MTNTYTSILADAIQGFIREREALGYRYRKQAACLKRFDTLCVEVGHSEAALSRELAMRWAAKKPWESDNAQCRRIRLVRRLATYMARAGYEAYIYPDHLGVHRSDTYQPYIFSEAELARFFARVDQCVPLRRSPHRHRVFPLLLSPKNDGPMYERSGGSNELLISVMPAAVFEPTAAYVNGSV